MEEVKIGLKRIFEAVKVEDQEISKRNFWIRSTNSLERLNQEVEKGKE
jgi:hypothetical protein